MSDTFIRKDNRYGWRASTSVPLLVAPIGETGEWEVTITTCKRSSGQISTRAIVQKLDGGFTVFRMFHDFTCDLWISPAARATEKNIAECHAKGLERINGAFWATIEAHYQAEHEKRLEGLKAAAAA